MAKTSKPRLDKNFVDALQGDDELGVVVRSHIHIEAKLNAYIEALVPHPEKLPSLRYYQKIDLACALGMPSMHAPLLKALGDIRNSFAHKLDAGITKQAVAKLLSTLCDLDRKAVEVTFNGLLEAGADAGGTDFHEISPKYQFIVVALVLDSMLAVVLNRAIAIAHSPQRRKERAIHSLDAIVKGMTTPERK